MTTSTSTPRRSSSGRTAAQLPTTPTDSASLLPARCGDQRDRLVEARRDPVEVALADPPVQPVAVDVDDQARAAVEGHRERLRAAHPAAASRSRSACRRASRRTAWRRPRRASRRCPAGCPACRCRSTSPRSSARTWSGRAARAGGTRARSPSRRRGSSWRSARAAPTRASAARRPACPTGPAASRRRRAWSASARWRRTRPTTGPPCRCRRRRPGRRGARRPRGRGCS